MQRRINKLLFFLSPNTHFVWRFYANIQDCASMRRQSYPIKLVRLLQFSLLALLYIVRQLAVCHLERWILCCHYCGECTCCHSRFSDGRLSYVFAGILESSCISGHSICCCTSLSLFIWYCCHASQPLRITSEVVILILTSLSLPSRLAAKVCCHHAATFQLCSLRPVVSLAWY